MDIIKVGDYVTIKSYPKVICKVVDVGYSSEHFYPYIVVLQDDRRGVKTMETVGRIVKLSDVDAVVYKLKGSL